jgi:threonylcarbamoyladenosine tRNA methylthiotransferase MtaB
MKVAAHTLGCKNNQLETSTILDEFKSNNWEVVNFVDVADIYIINTCTVTAKSDSHSRTAIRKAIKTNPQAKIIVTGCYAQTSADEIARIEGVSLITGNAEKTRLFELACSLLDNNTPEICVKDIFEENEFENKRVFSASGRTRINIKVQDGCNYRCSYCIVPFARGKSRSNKLNNVISQVSDVARDYPEVVLTGIHLGQYGLDFSPQLSLEALLRELEHIEHLKRLRLSSIDPHEITDSLIECLANSKKICRHLHISLQSGDNNILKAMKRRYTVEQYTEIINKLKHSIDGLAIGSDIIVGFPGEDETKFNNTLNTLESLPLSYLHVFTYSKRKGTIAAQMPDQVYSEVKKERNKILKDLSQRKSQRFRGLFSGKILEIIPENSRDRETNMLKGLSDNYITIFTEGDNSIKGKIVPVKITEITSNRTYGELFIN